jgi:hypothetical protein
MAYTDYSDLFVDSDGNALSDCLVFESCIDSAEQIIQEIAAGKRGRSRHGKTVYAHFGNGTYNLKTDDLMTIKGATSYPSLGLPKVGEGIILLNMTNGDLPYNLHCGAVVAKQGGQAVISHMFQLQQSPKAAQLIVIEITSPSDFARKTFSGSAGKYAVGWLSTDG